MTVEMLVAVVVLLVVKYTLELADRTRPRRRRWALKRRMAARGAPSFVIDVGARNTPPPVTRAAASPPNRLDGAALTSDHTRHTPPAFWDSLLDEIEQTARRGEDWRALLDERITGMQQLRARWREPAGEHD